MFILFAVAILIFTPFASAFGTFNEQQILQNTAVELQEELINEKPAGILGTAYLFVYAITYTQGEGLSPCVGANIRVKGLFRSYNGTTNEQGIYLFAVHTSLLREKYYFITVNATLGDHVVTKRAFIHIGARTIFTKGFLFLQLNES